MDARREDATSALLARVGGDVRAADALVTEVYRELRSLAASLLDGESAAYTLQPTALVHEAYLRMVHVDRVRWEGKTHFFAIAARQMRRVLVDRARRKLAIKRGNRPQRVTLDESCRVTDERTVDLLAIDQAMQRLTERHPRPGQVAELRLFGGLGTREAAFLLGVSERTVKGDWSLAKAWLRRELSAP